MTTEETTVSIKQFIEAHEITMTIDGGTDQVAMRRKVAIKDAEGWEHFAWTCILRHGDQTMEVPFRTGIGHAGPRRWTFSGWVNGFPKPPKVEDVLDCIANDCSGYENSRNFEDWASDYGYDTDSRKAHGIYEKVAEQAKHARQLLGMTLYEQLLWHTERL